MGGQRVDEVLVVRVPAGRKQEIVGVVLLLKLGVVELRVLLLLLPRRSIAKGGMPVARAGYALLLRFSQYMLWCRC